MEVSDPRFNPHFRVMWCKQFQKTYGRKKPIEDNFEERLDFVNFTKCLENVPVKDKKCRYISTLDLSIAILDFTDWEFADDAIFLATCLTHPDPVRGESVTDARIHTLLEKLQYMTLRPCIATFLPLYAFSKASESLCNRMHLTALLSVPILNKFKPLDIATAIAFACNAQRVDINGELNPIAPTSLQVECAESLTKECHTLYKRISRLPKKYEIFTFIFEECPDITEYKERGESVVLDVDLPFAIRPKSPITCGDFLGQGVSGSVFGGTIGDLDDEKKPIEVAVKRINWNFETDQDAVKELAFLQLQHSRNVLKMWWIATDKELKCRGDNHIETTRINIVLERMDFDMRKLFQEHAPLPMSIVIDITKQMLRGIAHSHSCNILHRDIKPENTMVKCTIEDDVLQSVDVKIADFGLSVFLFNQPMDSRCYTSWYRAPELFYDTTVHGPSADMWAMGAVMAEMYASYPAFMDETSDIFVYTNLPPPHVTEKYYKHKTFSEKFKTFINSKYAHPYVLGGKVLPRIGNVIERLKGEPDVHFEKRKLYIDLMGQLLRIDPDQRLSAAQALRHPVFDL